MASSASQLLPRRSFKEQDVLGRSGRKTRTRARSFNEMDLPERFRVDEDDNVDEGAGDNDDDPALLAQQSVYGMMAATQSKANFPSRFQQESESEEEDGQEESHSKKIEERRRMGDREHQTSKTLRKRPSEHGSKPARGFLKPVKERLYSQGQDAMTQSQILAPPRERAEQLDRPPSVRAEASSRTDAPILDSKLQAMARAEVELYTATSGGGREDHAEPRSGQLSKTLPEAVAGIFQLPEPEDVVSEYVCWYLQNVLLQGYMYITSKHICFFAYLQRRSNDTVKSGHIGKRGKHSFRYQRYWFVLKGDTFAYYQSSADPYTPLGMVDLRYAISADVTKRADAEQKSEEANDFTITTHDRVYYYRADTSNSAKEWVKQLQNIIFRARNDSDAVKISIPIKNLVDVEKTPLVDFAETVKLRVVATDETYAVDEYFFSFFKFSQEAVGMLMSLPYGNDTIDDMPDDSPQLRRAASPGLSLNSQSSPRQIKKQVRAALSNRSPCGTGSQHISGQIRRARADMGRAGSSRHRSSINNENALEYDAPQSPSLQESSESFVTSSEQQSEFDDDVIDAHMSASQMLTDDALFRGSTRRRPRLPVEAGICESDESSSETSPKRAAIKSHGDQPTSLEAKRSVDSDSTPASDEKKTQGTGVPVRSRFVRGISSSAPVQHAISAVGLVTSSGKKVGSYLPSSPKTYIGNWSAALAGGKRHYTSVEGLNPEDSIQEEQDLDVEQHESRYRKHFGLPLSEQLQSTFFCWLHKTVPLYGKIYMGTHRFCFRSLLYGTSTKLVIPYKDIINVQKQRGFRWGYPGMVLVIRGYEELFFDFPKNELRDEAVVLIHRQLENVDDSAQSMLLTQGEQEAATHAAAENEMLQAARNVEFTDIDLQLPENTREGEDDAAPIFFDNDPGSLLDFKPKKQMRITCLTIGSRGDVQPYIALCRGLLAEGHMPKIATHAEFRGWVEKYGIEFAEVSGDPAELMNVCVEHGMFTPSFLMEVNSKFRVWLDGLLHTAWNACKGADLLIESPSAMAGIHIAEALQIPYFRAFGMPWSRTRAYPHAFSTPNSKMGGSYNYMTYTFFDNMFWGMTAGQVNRWRGKALGLGPTSLGKLQQNKVPFLYNFSPSVVVPPLDFSDWIKVTGYWFLDEGGSDWVPPKDLAAFIQSARDDKQKLVYIGFGSVTVSDSQLMLQQIVAAVEKADVRCILAKGWSDRLDKDKPGEAAVPLPKTILQIQSAPHDWLFKQVDAVVHHGGAGTTGASLRAGVPTIIKPFFGDQFFFATRVDDLNVGIYLKKISEQALGRALWIATHDDRMRRKAHVVGEKIRAENGVNTAIKAIYRDLEYARGLVEQRKEKNSAAAGMDGADEGGALFDFDEDTEENWTFVEWDNMPEQEGDAAAATTTPATAKGSKLPLRGS